LIFGVPNIEADEAGFGVPKILDKPLEGVGFGVPKILDEPPEGAGLEPKILDPPDGPASLKPNFWGAGVLVGVVDWGLGTDWGFSCAGGVVLSMSASFASGPAGCFDASSSERPNPLPNKPPVPPLGFSLSPIAEVSALNVVPRTKGEDPKVDFAALGGKAVLVSIETSGALEGKAPPGFDPKIFEPAAESPPRDAKPVLPAKPANPPDAGAAVPLPNTLPGLDPEPGNPV
jgi:hypothetical protein